MEHKELYVGPGAGLHVLPRLLMGGDQHQQVQAAPDWKIGLRLTRRSILGSVYPMKYELEI